MTRTKRIFAILLSVAVAMSMMVAMSAVSFAADTTAHTITITNTDQHVTHTYEAYKVFEGNLDSQNKVLTNVAWADGVNSTALLAALKATTDPNLVDASGYSLFKDCTTASDVAKVLADFASTTGANQSAGAIDAVAAIIADNLGTKAADFTQDSSNAKKYTAEVTGDGYYFIKDTTTNLNNTTDKTSDSLSKYLLSVVKDTTIEAKDTGLTPNKTVTEKKVKANTAAIGDLVEFNVEIPVPNTKKYVDHFVFFMEDQLPVGLTLNEVTSVKINGTAVPVANYEVTADGAAYTKPADKEAGITAAGGQKIKVLFKDFKAYVEANNLIGETLTVTYNAYVNDDAVYGPTGNKNEVEFTYSNDPNHDYDGDEPGPQDPKGTTPKSETITYVTALKILKVDGKDQSPLEGAEFEISSTSYDFTLVVGERFVEDASGTYWKLKDGTYTTDDPNAEGMDKTKYDDLNKKYKKEAYNNTLVDGATDSKVTVISDANGVISVSGLKPGTYTVNETAAPSGFDKLDKEFKLVIAWTQSQSDPMAGTFSIGDGSDEGWKMTGSGACYEITIENNEGTQLPGTGGIGTTIFYVLGSLLVVGCGIVLISRKRMENNK
jgi:LPXTG-motif cell wall-anchored protein